MPEAMRYYLDRFGNGLSLLSDGRRNFGIFGVDQLHNFQRTESIEILRLRVSCLGG
jgi:hypothetical protein